MSNRLVTDRFSRWLVGAILLWLTGTLTASLLVGIALADPDGYSPGSACRGALCFHGIGIQAVLYSLLMEFCAWRIMGVNAPAVLVSALLGLLCGFSTVVFGERYFLEPVLFVGFAGWSDDRPGSVLSQKDNRPETLRPALWGVVA